MLTHRFCCDVCKKRIRIRATAPDCAPALPRGWIEIHDRSADQNRKHVCSPECAQAFLVSRCATGTTIHVSGRP